jgi:hypothetical protein
MPLPFLPSSPSLRAYVLVSVFTCARRCIAIVRGENDDAAHRPPRPIAHPSTPSTLNPKLYIINCSFLNLNPEP